MSFKINLPIRKFDRQPLDVELRISNSETSYHKHVLDSSFIDERIYEIFVSCFANSVSHDNQFNGYGPTKYRHDELLNLRSCLSDMGSQLNSVTSFELLKMLFNEEERRNHILVYLDEDYDMSQQWHNVLNQIIETNRGLIQIVSRCIREKKILWVLGI